MEFVTERIRATARRRRRSKFPNQEIPQLTRPPTFYKAHHRERIVTGRIL